MQPDPSSTNVAVCESNHSDTNASPSPTRKSLRPRSKKNDLQNTSQSKTKSRKRNIFTEDETSPGDEGKGR